MKQKLKEPEIIKVKPEGVFIDRIMKEQLDNVKRLVTKQDRDFVIVVDGEEGAGKSVLAMQIASYLDPKFNLSKIAFNSDQFMKAIKENARFSCVLLDEAYSAVNSRATLTEVNRSMVGIATEMRQRNLYVIMVLPSFFDLDKYFALWRCRALVHLYFDDKGARGRYVLFPKTQKKFLYLNGKRRYDYSKPKSPYPPMKFYNQYVVDEKEYRDKKSEAFKRRTVSNLARRWKDQRDALIKELYHNLKILTPEISFRIGQWKAHPLSEREVQRIVQLGEQF